MTGEVLVFDAVFELWLEVDHGFKGRETASCTCSFMLGAHIEENA